MKNRFKVIEFTSHYAVQDTETGKVASMSDGVDVLTTKNGRAMKPGSEYFRKTWERSLNENAGETAEAYFD